MEIFHSLYEKYGVLTFFGVCIFMAVVAFAVVSYYRSKYTKLKKQYSEDMTYQIDMARDANNRLLSLLAIHLAYRVRDCFKAEIGGQKIESDIIRLNFAISSNEAIYLRAKAHGAYMEEVANELQVQLGIKRKIHIEIHYTGNHRTTEKQENVT